MVRSERIACAKVEDRAHRMGLELGDVRETGAALDAGEEGGDEDCVEGEVG